MKWLRTKVPWPFLKIEPVGLSEIWLMKLKDM